MVDLLLDVGAGRGGVVKLSPGVSQSRLSAATKLLALLDRMPALEPSVDLVARTMWAVDADKTRTLAQASATTLAATPLH